jgi:hypothetical protein
MPEYKYANHHGEIENCPPNNYKKTDRTGYRFVFSNAAEANRNFVPVHITNPARAVSCVSSTGKCMGFGLSFYNTDVNAERKFNLLRSHIRQIHKSIGDSLAAVMITKQDGVCSPVDSTEGHFTLHEFEGAQLQSQVIRSLL